MLSLAYISGSEVMYIQKNTDKYVYRKQDIGTTRMFTLKLVKSKKYFSIDLYSIGISFAKIPETSFFRICQNFYLNLL